ncbi:MAG: DUF4149 domain-containing protein [Acidobacteriota bacterium]
MTSRASRIRIALLGLWVGAAALFSFVVAPAAFGVLPTTQLAGNLVSRVLGGVEIIGLIVGVVVLIVLVIEWIREKRTSVFEVIVCSLMTISMALSRFVISPRLHLLRAQYGDRMAALPAEDAARASFNLLHQVSVGLLSFSLFAGLAMLAVILWRDSRPGQSDA